MNTVKTMQTQPMNPKQSNSLPQFSVSLPRGYSCASANPLPGTASYHGSSPGT